MSRWSLVSLTNVVSSPMSPACKESINVEQEKDVYNRLKQKKSVMA